MIVRPDVWGPQTRIRLSNAFGTKPVTFNDAFVGLQESGSAILKGTNQPSCSAARRASPSQPGQSVVSDAVALPFVKTPPDPLLRGPQACGELPRRGRERPDDLARQGAADLLPLARRAPARKAQDEGESAFPFSTTSWYFLDEVDMNCQPSADVDRGLRQFDHRRHGTTINGDDRWPDVLSRRLHAAYGDDFVVVNQGIGGNQVVGPGGVHAGQADRRRSQCAVAARPRHHRACPASPP